MSIANKLTYLNTTKTKIKDAINTTGANITNETFRSYAQTIKDKIVDTINNPMTTWNSFPKVTGEGTSLTLNNTYESYIGMNLKGNTSQTGTPTPSSPIPVNVVSGNNTIKVTGKNLAYMKNGTYTYNHNTGVISNNNIMTLNTSGSTGSDSYFSFANGYTTQWAPTSNIQGINDMNLTSNGGDYVATVITNKTMPSAVNIYFWTSKGRNWQRRIETYTKVVATMSLDEDEHIKDIGIWVAGSSNVFENYTIQVQLEKGNTATDYEPYNATSYPINLGVENLFDKDSATLNVGINTSNGNTYNDTNLFSTDYIPISINTTYRANSASTTGNRVFGACYDSNKSYLGAVSTGVGERVFTVTNANAKYVRITGQKVNIDTYQLEKGSKTNSYTPYGTTPIELAEISTYNDEIFRTSGKNLFDKNTITSGYRLDGSGIPNGSASNEFTSDFIEVESGETYIRNYGGISAYTRMCFYDKNKSFVSKNDDSQSITIPDNVKYIRFSEYLSRLDTMQLEKGSSATEYNPFGTGEWYYKEAIKKIVLDGTETISAFDATSLSGSYQATFGITARATTTDKVAISDKFISALLSDRTTKTNIIYSYSDGYLRIATNVANTMAGFKTWLGTNNPKVLLEAATPTYNKITYEPLLEQLEAFYRAKSRKGQTNISQENNDLPFKIDASALEG